MTTINTSPSVVSVENLSLIAHNNTPVITTELLAQLYATETDNIRKNFSRNLERFVEGKHFIKLQGDVFKAFRLQVTNSHLQISPKTRHLILWTERGAARHAKMLDTDQAWEVFEKLEDCYFTKKPVEQFALTNGQHYVVAKDGVVIFHKVLSDRTAKGYLQHKPTQECEQALGLMKSLQDVEKLSGDINYGQVRDGIRQLLIHLGQYQPYEQVRPAIIVLEATERMMCRLWTMIDESSFRASLLQNLAKSGRPMTDGNMDTLGHINSILSRKMMMVQLPSYQ